LSGVLQGLRISGASDQVLIEICRTCDQPRLGDLHPDDQPLPSQIDGRLEPVKADDAVRTILQQRGRAAIVRAFDDRPQARQQLPLAPVCPVLRSIVPTGPRELDRAEIGTAGWRCLQRAVDGTRRLP
jgi:hypothetical protein